MRLIVLFVLVSHVHYSGKYAILWLSLKEHSKGLFFLEHKINIVLYDYSCVNIIQYTVSPLCHVTNNAKWMTKRNSLRTDDYIYIGKKAVKYARKSRALIKVIL